MDDVPHIDHYTAAGDKKNGAAVLICPGGGYTHLATGHEGKTLPEFFTAQGYDAIVLHYRLNDGSRAVPLPGAVQRCDQRHAPREKQSEKLGLNPEKDRRTGLRQPAGTWRPRCTHHDRSRQPAGRQRSREMELPPGLRRTGVSRDSHEQRIAHKGSALNLLGLDASAAKKDSSSDFTPHHP